MTRQPEQRGDHPWRATWKLAAHGGSFRLKPGMPRYAGFEGHGMVDNFVLRRLGGSVQ